MGLKREFLVIQKKPREKHVRCKYAVLLVIAVILGATTVQASSTATLVEIYNENLTVHVITAGESPVVQATGETLVKDFEAENYRVKKAVMTDSRDLEAFGLKRGLVIFVGHGLIGGGFYLDSSGVVSREAILAFLQSSPANLHVFAACYSSALQVKPNVIGFDGLVDAKVALVQTEAVVHQYFSNDRGIIKVTEFAGKHGQELALRSKFPRYFGQTLGLSGTVYPVLFGVNADYNYNNEYTGTIGITVDAGLLPSPYFNGIIFNGGEISGQLRISGGNMYGVISRTGHGVAQLTLEEAKEIKTHLDNGNEDYLLAYAYTFAQVTGFDTVAEAGLVGTALAIAIAVVISFLLVLGFLVLVMEYLDEYHPEWTYDLVKTIISILNFFTWMPIIGDFFQNVQDRLRTLQRAIEDAADAANTPPKEEWPSITMLESRWAFLTNNRDSYIEDEEYLYLYLMAQEIYGVQFRWQEGGVDRDTYQVTCNAAPVYPLDFGEIKTIYVNIRELQIAIMMELLKIDWHSPDAIGAVGEIAFIAWALDEVNRGYISGFTTVGVSMGDVVNNDFLVWSYFAPTHLHIDKYIVEVKSRLPLNPGGETVAKAYGSARDDLNRKLANTGMEYPGRIAAGFYLPETLIAIGWWHLTFGGSSETGSADSDSDGMPNDWEELHGLDITANDAQADLDGDGLTNFREYLSGTYPNATDTDVDGLSDGLEVNTFQSDPLDPDTDNDGLTDGGEVLSIGTYTNWNPGEPNNWGAGEDHGEMYSNGKWNDNGPPAFPYTVRYYVCEWQDTGHGGAYYFGHEYKLFTTATTWLGAKADCEARGGHLVVITSSGENAFVSSLAGNNVVWIGYTDRPAEGTWRWVTGEHGTSPTSIDSDNDGMGDGWEVYNGLSPFVANANSDPDGDGLTNIEEYDRRTHPMKADTDGDGMPDGWEVDHGLDPTVANAGADMDNDGLTNIEEYMAGTHPWAHDSDGDDLNDGSEVNIYHTDPLDSDSDNDGLSDGYEVNTSKTDPNNPDCDYDGIPDGDDPDPKTSPYVKVKTYNLMNGKGKIKVDALWYPAKIYRVRIRWGFTAGDYSKGQDNWYPNSHTFSEYSSAIYRGPSGGKIYYEVKVYTSSTTVVYSKTGYFVVTADGPVPV